MGKTSPAQSERSFADINVDDILEADAFNPRTSLGDMEEMVDSLRERGLINPITVCPANDGTGTYFLVAGARRLEGCRRLGMRTIGCVVRNGLDITSSEALAVAIAENMDGARATLPPLDLARAYKRLLEQLSATGGYETQTAAWSAVAKMVGRTREHVRSTLSLLEAPGAMQEKLADGSITKQAVRTLMEVPESVRQRVADRLDELPADRRTEGDVRRIANEFIKEDSVGEPVDLEGDEPKKTTKRKVVLWRSKTEVRAEVDIVIGHILSARKENDDSAVDTYSSALAALLWVTGELDANTVGTAEYNAAFKVLSKERRARQEALVADNAEGDN